MAKMAKTATKTKPDKAVSHSHSCVWLGDFTSELAWTASKLKARIPVLRLDDPELLAEFGAQVNPSHVVIGVHRRSEEIQRLYALASELWPESKLVILLGEFWPGHRRCYPLPESWNTYYWYQWWENLQFEFQKINEFAGSSTSDVNQSNKVPASWSNRLQRIAASCARFPESPVQRLALVTVDDRPMRDMWDDLLPSLGWTPVFRSSQDPIPVARFELAIFDTAFMDLLSPDGMRDSQVEIERISRMATYNVAVRDGFPHLDRWKNWESSGAKWIFSDPIMRFAHAE